MTAQQQAAEQIDILAPDITTTIAGREITMREPKWLESLDIEAALEPCVKFLRDAIDGTEITPNISDAFLSLLLQMMRAHKTEMTTVMAFCAGVEVAWVESLGDEDGTKLMMLFWRVNWHFFVRRLNRLRSLAALSGQTVGVASSAH